MKTTSNNIVAAVTQAALFEQSFPIVETKWWRRLMQRIGLLPKSRTIKIFPPYPATVFKIAAEVTELKPPAGKVNENNVYDVFMDMNHDNLKRLINIVAIASHNAKGEPDPDLPDIIAHNFSYADLRKAIEAVHRGLDVENFFAIMALVRNIGISDMLATEAPGQRSEGLSNTTDSDGRK